MSSSYYSVVEFFTDSGGSRCGYCKGKQTYYSRGMWAHAMSCKEYQNLIDRGWRRSGHYCYKPHMPTTCCPMYAIKCDTENIRLSKSQKKVLKKFYNFLRFGNTPRDFPSGSKSDSGSSTEGEVSGQNVAACEEEENAVPSTVELDNIFLDTSVTEEVLDQGSHEELQDLDLNKAKDLLEHSSESDMDVTTTGEAGASHADETSPNHPLIKKAKVIRMENKYKKLISRGLSEEEAYQRVYEHRKNIPERKQLKFEDYFPCTEDTTYFAHQFTVKLLPVTEILEDPVMMYEAHKLYKKYQIVVHGDTPEECTLQQFKRFLVSSPLQESHSNLTPECGFGSFHQQYWLDGKLAAVGVIDILPKCVSSVYFFYDPELRSLSMGTYGSLHEIYFTRSLTQQCAALRFYYLGFYINECPKMSYKARYTPSFLLCPETFTWHKIENCLPKLNENKYSRLEEDPDVIDENRVVNLDKVMILHKNRAISYPKYKKANPNSNDEELVHEYAKLVGYEGYKNILLYRS